MTYVVVARTQGDINFKQLLKSENYQDCRDFLLNGLVQAKLIVSDEDKARVPRNTEYVFFYDQDLMVCRELHISEKKDPTHPCHRFVRDEFYTPEVSGGVINSVWDVEYVSRMGKSNRLDDWMRAQKLRDLRR